MSRATHCLLFTRQTNFLLTRSHLVRAVDSIPKFFIAPEEIQQLRIVLPTERAGGVKGEGGPF